MKMKRMIALICTAVILCIVSAGCAAQPAETQGGGREDSSAARVLPYRFADREEGIQLLMSNDAYYDGFSANELAFKMQSLTATIDEYKEFSREQVCEFSEEEKALIDEYMASIEKKIADDGFHLPPLDEIVFICTTMEEEGGASAYTHGTQIYFGKEVIDRFIEKGTYDPYMEFLLAHEVFHCLTRCNPVFRADMYKIIHFTVKDEFAIPPSVMEYYISNPDVEHHNAYAGFMIDGRPVDCFLALVTTKHFENKGESFFDTATPVLVPIDGSDICYYPEDASNFDDVFGRNTEYTDDPEECMADNFSYFIVYGIDGPQGNGYQSPEIIEAIRDYLKK